jgi:hypothetical protein
VLDLVLCELASGLSIWVLNSIPSIQNNTQQTPASMSLKLQAQIQWDDSAHSCTTSAELKNNTQSLKQTENDLDVAHNELEQALAAQLSCSN